MNLATSQPAVATAMNNGTKSAVRVMPERNQPTMVKLTNTKQPTNEKMMGNSLPQTGENTGTKATLLGLTLLGLASFTKFLVPRRKRNFKKNQSSLIETAF